MYTTQVIDLKTTAIKFTLNIKNFFGATAQTLKGKPFSRQSQCVSRTCNCCRLTRARGEGYLSMTWLISVRRGELPLLPLRTLRKGGKILLMFSLGRRGLAVGRGRGEKKEKGGEDSRLHLTYINRRESLVGSGYGERNENCRKKVYTRRWDDGTGG